MKKHPFSARFLMVLLLAAALLFPLTACQNDVDETPPCAHSQSTWSVEREATETEAGIKNRRCTACGTTLETEVIPMLDLTKDRVTTKLAPSMVKVVGYGEDGTTEVSQGSGFFIDAKGTFITNAHVVENCHFVQIVDHSGQIYNANVLLAFANKTSDYAILSIAEEITSTPVTFTEAANIGSTVYALGFPNDAEALCCTKGELLEELSAKYHRSSVETAAGNSGGALVDVEGSVIGITTSILQNKVCMVLKYTDFQKAVAAVLAGTVTPVRELPLRGV